jgi:hypothetical protein
MTQGPCRLCGAIADLQESHIIPSFVYKWLKDSSGGGHLRSAEQPNKRIQDGHKLSWLCWDCEQRFNHWETQFAQQVFHPINQGKISRVTYGPWLLLFCVSVSWRVLNFHIDKNYVNHIPEDFQGNVKRAEETWREVLLSQRLHPEQYEQHFLPMDIIESHTLSDMPVNINRYILRSADIDTAYGGQTAFTYSKLGRFIILGFLVKPPARQWRGTKVHVKHGTIEPRSYTIPWQFIEYMKGKAKRAAVVQSQISEKQNEKIAASFRKDIDRVANSETFYALSHDVRLFGLDAFSKEDER